MRPFPVGALARGMAPAILLAACAPPPSPEWHDAADHRWRALEVPRGRAGFTAMRSSRTGIDFRNTVSERVLLGNRILGQGAGVCLGDVDGDGRADIFLARTEGPNALYRNGGDWRFEDITGHAGVAAADRYSSGCALADIDGDGDLDLLLLATTGPNAIFLNDGAARFTERRDLGLDSLGRGGTTIAMADADGDDRLDLYVANYKPHHPSDTVTPQRRTFSQIVRQVAPDRYEVVPEHRADFKLVMRPDMGGLNLTMRGAPDEFYRNAGGRFTRVAETGGAFLDAEGHPLAAERESFTLAARFADIDGDGAPDLYVVNDFEDADELWLNDGHGRFGLAGWTALRQMSSSAMAVDIGDLSGDGRPELFVVDMLSNDSRRLRTQIPTHSALPKRPGELAMQLQHQRNTLHLNRGDGTFAEIGVLAGVHASGWSWSTMFLDVDLDGWQDILVANGHLWDIMDADTQERLQNRLTDVIWQRQRWEYPPLPLRNVAFRNRGDLTFEDAGEGWGFGVEEDISHAMAAADLDGDGDLDVVVNRLGAPALVLRNDGGAPRVAVRLLGDAPNTRAVGAKVRLRAAGLPSQTREIVTGGLYMSHSDHQLTFAIGAAQSAELEVEWRDGRRTTIDVRPNRLYEIRASTTGPTGGDTAHVDEALFEDVSAQLGGHTHVDPWFDDWERQFMLPGSLSQLGPGVSWIDLDRDGREDLLVGSGTGGRLAVFRNRGGRLVHERREGPPAPADLTTILGLPGERGTRLLIGISNWEGYASTGATRHPAVASVAAAPSGVANTLTPVVPPTEWATGPMALADHDGDGDLDLFVGGRALAGEYPRRPSSMLFRNDGGRFVIDSANADVLVDVGMVSSATFADVNGDGRPDLLLAREWDSILLLLNDDGRFVPAPASWGLERWTSRWNGIAVGDLDGDGRLDVVATSWGRNTMLPADSAAPLVILHGRFGTGGEEEMLLARHDRRLDALAPLGSYARGRVAIAGLTDRVASFGEYADAGLERILGPHLAAAERRAAVTMDHMLFLNRGNRFDAVPLPAEAQFAPAFHASIADFDGDGAEDVFLAQNFFPTALGLPRYDAGRGLLLRGDGRGGLAPVGADRSGIRVHGDQRGAAHADFDGDGRLDLVVTQNAAATRLLRNRGARPGLRVRVEGPASNPDAVGAQLRVEYGDARGPVREIQAGSGYWSQNGAVQVLGLARAPSAVWVRWPGGGETRMSVPAGVLEVLVRRQSARSR